MMMPRATSRKNMHSPGMEEIERSESKRVRRAIVVVDVVESVRLMQAYEDDVIKRWRGFIAEVCAEVLPQNGGRLVKGLGDGMLLEFGSSPAAAKASAEMHTRIQRRNIAREIAASLYLRVGAHMADVVVDELDVYGAGVNLAARLSGLASPGETVVSSDFRDGLAPGLDAEAEDLGECQLKNIEGTTRAFRLGGSQTAIVLPSFDTYWEQRPTFAVLPLETAANDLDAELVADVLTDQIIHDLSLSGVWRVISRLTMTAFRGRNPKLDELQRHLKPTWLLSGRCRLKGDRVQASLELADARSGTVLWSKLLEDHKDTLLHIDGALGAQLVESMLGSIFNFELQRSRTHPLPTLASHTLLLSAVALMHRLSKPDFMRGRALLEHLCERHPRAPEPQAWFAKWHVMRVAQGWSADPQADAQAGRQRAQRALNERSDHALGLAVDGLVAGFLMQDLALSEQRYEAAIAANPNESLAWLFRSALHAYRDEGASAAHAAQTALHLSPLDPIRYYYDSFAAHAMLAAGQLPEAIALAQRSLRANSTHVPTHRSLAIAQILAGEANAARTSVKRLLQLSPQYTIDQFISRYPGRDSAFAKTCVQALKEAGLPTQ